MTNEKMNQQDVTCDHATIVRCKHCSTVVVEGPGKPIIVTHFPKDTANCLALLSGQMGTVICPHCGRLVDTKVARLIVLNDQQMILGLPETWSPEERKQAASQIRAKLPDATLSVSKNQSTFRTEVIRVALSPPMELLRSYTLAKLPMQWISANAERLDKVFFSSLWLMGSGAVQTYLQPYDGNSDLPVFVPKELAPEEARHVVRREEATRHLRQQSGELLGWLLTHFVIRTIEERRLDILVVDLPAAVPAVLLGDDDTRSALTKHIESTIAKSKPGQWGWITFAYLHEAALALLCATHEFDNPHRDTWTFWYLFYDMNRRLDDNDESLLPLVEVLHRTLNAAEFWRQFHNLVRKIARDTKGDHESMGVHLEALIQTGSRVFPEELPSQMEQYLQLVTDKKLGNDQAYELIRAALQLPLNDVTLRCNIAALCRQQSVPVAMLILQVLDDPETPLSDGDRIAIMRCAMEFLKEHGRVEEAAQLLGLGRTIVEAAIQLCRSPDASNTVESRTLGHFLNEVGNILRLLHRLDDAVEVYSLALEFIGGGLDDANHRVGLRNLGIVLRELHRYREALDIFRSLRPKARPLEMRGLVTSEALCLFEAGQVAEARALMLQYVDHVQEASPEEAGVLEFCTLLGALLADAGMIDKAVAMLAAIQPVARQKNYHAAIIVARDLDLQRAGTVEERRLVIGDQIKVLKRLGSQPIGALVLNAVRRVVESLLDLGELGRAEQLLHEMAAATNPSLCPRGWYLYAEAATLAAQRGDVTKSAYNIDIALAYLQAGVATAVSSGDLQDFTAPDAPRLDRLAAEALDCRTNDPRCDERRWRNAADALAAPALTARLRGAAGLPPCLDAPDDEDRRIEAWLRASGGAIVQFCGADGQVVLLRTTLDANGQLHTDQHPLSISTSTAHSLARKLSFRLLRTDPACAELPLHKLPDWPAISQALEMAFAGLPVDRSLLVIAGPLQEAVISLALGHRYPLCFAPSLGGAVALHERSPSTVSEPRTLFGFATWFDCESPGPAAALAAVPGDLAGIAAHHGLVTNNAAGLNATRQSLLDGLSNADAAWVACHGQVRHTEASVDLLVAAEGRLPPAHLRDAAYRLRGEHVVKWEDIAALERTPQVVFSSACDSGLTHTNIAGERLGLERALLPAGTAQFVAPLWPVPTVAIQRIVARLIDLWLNDLATPLAVHLMRNRQWCIDEGLPPLASHALALFGLHSTSRKLQ